jgi:ABC-type lipoprotein export system ATPase subunit
MNRHLLTLKGVKKLFDQGKVIALNGIDMDVADGEFVAIMGASGSGKSTLLSIVGGLEMQTEGDVLVNGSSLSWKGIEDYRQKFVGFIFQAFHLLPTFNALENVQLPMIGTARGKKERIKRAEEVLEAVGLSNRKYHLPQNMSGGERQRVAIARSLVNNPSLLLADEPTGNLDSASSVSILDTIQRINRTQGTTVILVTHESFVSEYAGRIIKIKDGKIEGYS